jgi:hypothetical protein
MKLVPTILSAALIAGASTVAMAQSDGGAGGDVNPNRFGKGTDANPSSPGANPRLGNSAAPPSQRLNDNPYGAGSESRDMNSSDVSGRWSDPDYQRGPRTAPNGTPR